jgi:hypothetical protein
MKKKYTEKALWVAVTFVFFAIAMFGGGGLVRWLWSNEILTMAWGVAVVTIFFWVSRKGAWLHKKLWR